MKFARYVLFTFVGLPNPVLTLSDMKDTSKILRYDIMQKNISGAQGLLLWLDSRVEKGLHVRSVPLIFSNKVWGSGAETHIVSSDYRGLKKLITAIKNAKLEDELEPLQESSHATPRASFSPVDGNTQSRGRADDHITDSGITGLTSQSSPITPTVSRSSVEHFRSSSELENQRPASPSIASTRVASTDSTILRPKPGRALTEYIPPKVNYARSSIAEIPLEEAESSGRNPNHTTSGGFLQNLRRRHTMFTCEST